MAFINEKRKQLDDNLTKIFLKFSFKELHEKILPVVFEEVSWNIIVKAIERYNLSAKMSHIGKILLEYMKTYTLEEAQETYGQLMLLDTMLHRSKKTWYAVHMKQVDEMPTDEDYSKNIIRSFRKQAKNVLVYSDISDNIRWFVLVICRKTRSEGFSHQMPIYLAYPLNSNYIFYSPKNVKLETMKILIRGFGYEDHKISKLSGKNIFSLISMLDRHKKADELRMKTSQALKCVVENQGVRSSRGIDFCQDKVRTAHAKELFGDESIELQSLTVNINTDWRGVRTVPQCEGKEFNMKVRLRSKDVRKTLESFVRKGIMKQPYPVWAKEFLISGKNIINIG